MNDQVIPERLIWVRHAVNEALQVYCKTQTAQAIKIHPDFGRLWQAITDVVTAGGKRLRPYLAVLLYEGYGGTDTAAFLRIACAWELLHVSMLMHDDVIDRDYMRHGRPNVAGYLREAYKTYTYAEPSHTHFADGGAIMAGDALLAAGHHLIMTSDVSAAQKALATELLGDAVFAVAGGELLDTEAAMQSLMNVDAELIAVLKTAEYSLIGPMLTGAVLADADQATRHNLRELGRLLGIAYQYADDLLDVIGDEATTGKGVGHDVREGKRTELLKIAYTRAAPDDKASITRVLTSDHITQEDADTLRDIIMRTGAIEQLEQRIASYEQQALSLLERLSMQAACKDELRWMIGYALHRDA
ncbi:MAG TPA: polyprenyl synthetase family protein [Candidatus Saccharimonadales bacterium]|jgi:geranylgeranyl diphosphate synthase type II|nr:polyprenyl synthetase family protein [Candidatus Saccharimonadales bacterium]